jgi:hypothetical protein
MQWQVADCLARFYRPNFETLLYPYCPTHIERPKEMKKIFLLNLPERAFLSVRCQPWAAAGPLFLLCWDCFSDVAPNKLQHLRTYNRVVRHRPATHHSRRHNQGCFANAMDCIASSWLSCQIACMLLSTEGREVGTSGCCLAATSHRSLWEGC